MSPYLIYKLCTISSALEAGLTVYINVYFSFSYTIKIIWKRCIKLQPNSLSVLTSSVVYRVVKSKTITLAFASSLLNTQHQGVRAKTGWPWISNTVSEWNDMSSRGLLLVKLKSSLRKYYGRHHSLVDRYGVSVSHITTNMYHLSKTLPGSLLIRDLLPGF